MPTPPLPLAVYDFGPGSIEPEPSHSAAAVRTPLMLADVRVPSLAEGSTALQYRLAYDDAQQLRAYQRARWSQPPAQLVRQTVANELAQQWTVLDSSSAREAVRASSLGNGDHALLVVRLEIDEFSQIFSSAAQSNGALRLRATLTEASPQGERLRGQRVFVAQSPASSQDAAGGSAAMAHAAHQVARELATWIEQTAR